MRGIQKSKLMNTRFKAERKSKRGIKDKEPTYYYLRMADQKSQYSVPLWERNTRDNGKCKI
jgi:hypothetical protein